MEPAALSARPALFLLDRVDGLVVLELVAHGEHQIVGGDVLGVEVVIGEVVKVVDHGTGKAAHVEGLTVAGKTGTAQKIDPVTHQYSNDRYLASFCGFAPVESPRLVVGVFLDDPRTSYWGGSEAAPLFARIVRDAASSLHIESTDLGPVAFTHTLTHL